MTAAVEQSKPWWREPWPWILMAGPALAIVGCAITIVLATQGFDRQTVADGGRKQGLVVTKSPSAAVSPSVKEGTPVE